MNFRSVVSAETSIRMPHASGHAHHHHHHHHARATVSKPKVQQYEYVRRPVSNTCYFRDPFNGNRIKVARGGLFQDSRARIYTVDDHCQLTTPRMCCYTDRPSGMRICSATGGDLVTRSGTVYKVGDDCSLTRYR